MFVQSSAVLVGKVDCYFLLEIQRIKEFDFGFALAYILSDEKLNKRKLPPNRNSAFSNTRDNTEFHLIRVYNETEIHRKISMIPDRKIWDLDFPAKVLNSISGTKSTREGCQIHFTIH